MDSVSFMANKSVKETGRRKSITEKEYKSILDLASSNLRDWFFLYLVGNWGLRVGEAIRLKVEDFKIKEAIVRVPRIKIKGKGRLERGEVSGRYDEMPFDYRPSEYLERYLNTYNIREGWVFQGNGNKHISESRAQKIFYHYVKQIKVKASIHSLRHYKGYSIYDKTTDVLAVKAVLRHKSIRSSEVYTEPTLELRKKIMDIGGYVDHEGFYKKEDTLTLEDKKKLRVNYMMTKEKKWRRVPA